MRPSPNSKAAKTPEPHEPVRLDVTVDAYVPSDYVTYEQAKIELHRRIAGARELSDVGALREELADRFGPVPEPLERLLQLQEARLKFGRCGVPTVGFHGGPAGGDADRSRRRSGGRLREDRPTASTIGASDHYRPARRWGARRAVRMLCRDGRCFGGAIGSA